MSTPGTQFQQYLPQYSRNFSNPVVTESEQESAPAAPNPQALLQFLHTSHQQRCSALVGHDVQEQDVELPACQNKEAYELSATPPSPRFQPRREPGGFDVDVGIKILLERNEEILETAKELRNMGGNM